MKINLKNYYVIKLVRFLKEEGIYSKKKLALIQSLFDDIDCKCIDTPAMLAHYVLHGDRAQSKYINTVIDKQCKDVAIWLVKNGHEPFVEKIDYGWLKNAIETFQLKCSLRSRYCINASVSEPLRELFFGDVFI